MTEVARFTTPGSFRRHFDRMLNFPSGLLPLGDAIAASIRSTARA